MTKSSQTELFAERLRNARETRAVSQADLAKKAGLAPSAISHFETGTRRPSFANLRRLADALEVSTDFLLGRTREMSGASVDVMFRDIGSLSESDREVIRGLAAQLAKRGSGGPDDGT